METFSTNFPAPYDPLQILHSRPAASGVAGDKHGNLESES